MSDPIFRNRHSLRLMDYEYSLEGAYFITLVTYNRMCLFGTVVNGDIELNQSGRIAFDQWTRLEKRFHPSDFSKFIIMPNHVHGIIYIVRGAGEEFESGTSGIPPLRPYTIPNVAPGSLGAIVRAYKASVTFRINAMRGFTYPPVWQRNYYEQIIWNEKEFENIWKYIDANPERWNEDHLHLSAAL